MTAITRQPVNFEEVFRSTSKKLLEEYEITRKALAQRVLKGAAREEALEQFLTDHLPPQFKCVTGEIVSTTDRSRQVDLIVSHATRAPTLYRSGNIHVVLVEAVLAAIEVKTHLSGTELSKALENIQSVKALAKTAFYKREDPMRSRHKAMQKPRPIPCFIFAYNSIALDRILQKITCAQEDTTKEHWIDGIFILEKGHIMLNALDFRYITKTEPQSTLLSFYLKIWEHLILAWTPPIRLDAYFPLSAAPKPRPH